MRAHALRSLLFVAIVASVTALASFSTAAAEPTIEATELPPLFKQTFLDLRSDVRDAARAGKRVMLYFGQEGCPYCRRLLQDNLRQKDIAERVEKHLYPIALDLWGDREVTWLDGTASTEKALALRLQVQFTPTLLFLDESGRVIARINGYYPPHRFRAAVDYVATHRENRMAFDAYMRTAVKEPANGKLNAYALFPEPPLDLARTGKGKPLALFVEQTSCAACDEMHAGPLNQEATRQLLRRFDVARIDLFGNTILTGPAGQRMGEAKLAAALKVAYTPSLLLFDAGGKEVFRVEGYVRAWHLQGALDYVASGAYRNQPSFQRFLRERADQRRQQGDRVSIW